MRKSRIASRCCCLASRYCRIAGVADVDIFCKSSKCVCWLLTPRRAAGSVAIVDDERRADRGDRRSGAIACGTAARRHSPRARALGHRGGLHRSVCDRRGARNIYRAPHRDCDHSRTGVRERQAGRSGLRAHGARRRGESRGALRDASSARGWMRIDATCSARCTGKRIARRSIPTG